MALNVDGQQRWVLANHFLLKLVLKTQDFCPQYSVKFISADFGWKIFQNLKMNALSENFSAEMEFCKIDPSVHI
jgi:hypothetical protein